MRIKKSNLLDILLIPYDFSKNYRARDVATFVRFGHLTKPNRLLTSITAVAEQVRTVEISITFRSNPENEKNDTQKFSTLILIAVFGY